MRPLRRNRLLLIASLMFLGAALGLTANLLKPDGLVRAGLIRTGLFRMGLTERGGHGPSRYAEPPDVEGYGADRFGAPCGVRGWVRGELREMPLPLCTSYLAPAVTRLDGARIVIWERADQDIAIGFLDEELRVDRITAVPRPRAAYGALLPRTEVVSDRDRLAIWYDDALLVTLDGALTPWPGGAPEVARARLGPRGPVVLLGVFALFALCLLGVSWTLTLPWRLARHRRAGRTLEVDLAARGTRVVVGGRPLELDLSRAATMSGSLGSLAGHTVTLVLDRAVLLDHAAQHTTYRDLDRVGVHQVWPGDFREASMQARALRSGAVATAVSTLALLLLALDAYVIF